MYSASRRTFRTSLEPVDGSVGRNKSSGQWPREKATGESRNYARNIKDNSQKRYRGRFLCGNIGM
jgi:hypothetical protein